MNFLTVGMRVLFICHVIVTSHGRAMFEEQRCSKFDFEEKVLEKVLRFEIALESAQTKFDVLEEELMKQQHGLTKERNQHLQEFQSLKDDVVSDVTALRTAQERNQATAESQFKSLLQKTQDQVARISLDAQEILNKTGPVSAFTVKRPASAPNTNGISAVVRFTTVVYDASGDYDVTSGVFTCRHAGVYFFALSILKYKPGASYGRIPKGSEELIIAYVETSNAGYYETSNFVTTHLVPGDAVFVGNAQGVQYMHSHSSFSGFIVTAG